MAIDLTKRHRSIEVFAIFLRLGLTSFGGPIAHLAYFRKEFVERRGWLSDAAYAELVGLCQFIPGPASSQVGFAVGLQRAGYSGALAAWTGFTLPSAILLVLFALSMQYFGQQFPQEIIHGLKLVAVAIVSQAVWTMGRSLCPDAQRVFIMLASALVMIFFSHGLSQILVLALAGGAGLLLCQAGESELSRECVTGGKGAYVMLLLILYVAGLVTLPLLANAYPSDWLTLVNACYHAGALVFGGGHVVLPLLEAELAGGELGREALVSANDFLAGYGAAQAVPGPLFAFAAFLGAAGAGGENPLILALLALVAIFLPGFLLLLAVMPIWGQLRARPRIRSALRGINAAVVGLLLALLYNVLWKGSISSMVDIGIALSAVGLLIRLKLSPLIVVVFCVAMSYVESALI